MSVAWMKLPGAIPFRPLPGRLTRSLRFRLTISYVVFFSVLLASVGFLFRQVLVSLLDQQARALLEEEWGAINGYLRIERESSAGEMIRIEFEKELQAEERRFQALRPEAGRSTRLRQTAHARRSRLLRRRSAPGKPAAGRTARCRG